MHPVAQRLPVHARCCGPPRRGLRPRGPARSPATGGPVPASPPPSPAPAPRLPLDPSAPPPSSAPPSSARPAQASLNKTGKSQTSQQLGRLVSHRLRADDRRVPGLLQGQGNDLSTPVPEFEFPGLKPGDRWCLCAARWQEAFAAGKAPRVVLQATHKGAGGLPAGGSQAACAGLGVMDARGRYGAKAQRGARRSKIAPPLINGIHRSGNLDPARMIAVAMRSSIWPR